MACATVAVVYVRSDEGVVSKSMFKRFVMLCGADHSSVHHLIVVRWKVRTCTLRE
jgi:hypothetical protein